MDKVNNPEQVYFALKHARNTTYRMVPDLLETIVKTLHGQEIDYNGKKCVLSRLGDVRERDGEYRVSFDVLNPDDTFDHIEFTITKTGWGRSL